MLFLDKITYHQSGRPIFYVDKSYPCLGSGVLFYVKYNNNIYFLIQKEDNNQKYSFCDLGGKTDISDGNIIETAVREVMEETNGVLFSKLFRKKYHKEFGLNPTFKDYMINFYRLFKDYQPKFIYSNKSKYLIIMVELSAEYINHIMLPNKSDSLTILNEGFGNMEMGNTISRQIVWMELKQYASLLKDKKMHIRLKDTQMYHTIEMLKNK